MATANRLKTKKRGSQEHQIQSTSFQSSQQSTQPQKQKRTKIFSSGPINHEKQKQYQKYNEYKKANPNGIKFIGEVFPDQLQLHLDFNMPLGFTFSPLIILQNEHIQTMNKKIDQIPRCDNCRAYMNCYNTIQKQNKFICFFCNTINYTGDYKQNKLPNQQRNSTIYQVKGSSNFYQNIPAEHCVIFIVDVSKDAILSKILSFAVPAIKEVLAKTDFDQTIVLIYAFDDVIYQYDFSGEEIKCTIIDKTIDRDDKINKKLSKLKDNRTKLFEFLDQLEEFFQNNQKKQSNFALCFQYVYNCTLGLGGQYYIFQVNDNLSSEEMFRQQIKIADFGESHQMLKSLYDTKNKSFFTKYAQKFIQNANNFNMFIFGSQYKNIKVLGDVLKITSSNIKYYSKDSPIQLNKFYYELIYLLGATYYKQIRIQFLINSGWSYASVFGNSHRLKQYITFSLNSCESTRQFLIYVQPRKKFLNQLATSPFCAIQLVINYRYHKQHFVTVLTAIQTVTGNINKLYNGINGHQLVGAIGKCYLGLLRTDNQGVARQKLVQLISKIYLAALHCYKNIQSLPDGIKLILMGSLSMIKSIHGHPQTIKNSPLFDRVMGERNFLSFCGLEIISSFFIPYLFNLNDMDQNMCQDQQDNFIYPPTVQLRFCNVKEGLYLLDNGVALYLFVAKFCEQSLMKKIFGKSKFAKNQLLKQQMLYEIENQTQQLKQVKNLIRYLRIQKPYLWVPLYIVRCGQNTSVQRNFYLHFTLQSYDQFKMQKFSFQQYLQMLRRPQNPLLS